MTAEIVDVPRELIENRLLAALDDRTCTAILANEDDLNLFIEAFETSPVGSSDRGHTLLMDMKKLRAAAFT